MSVAPMGVLWMALVALDPCADGRIALDWPADIKPPD